MHPHYPGPPNDRRPDLLDRLASSDSDLLVHVLLTVCTCGLYLVFLPFILLFDQVEKVIDWAVDKFFAAIWWVVSAPFKALFALVRSARRQG
ncbi:hypothetical protein AB0J80_05535 [Actinoplanes sp. NPDC049548]|uniref:hypothetical protein n=1 Tax=Actinoplanes sp. NPDC049548 TaxID=3155152 RepID=UPI00341582B1